jgi:ATP-dependent Clp protease ATP-binding subunit ClpC
MFERYTEKARRVIFFARYQASQHGSPYIETEKAVPGTNQPRGSCSHRNRESDCSTRAHLYFRRDAADK